MKEKEKRMETKFLVFQGKLLLLTSSWLSVTVALISPASTPDSTGIALGSVGSGHPLSHAVMRA